MQGVLLAELTYEEAEAAFKKDWIVVLPIGGGTKEHGPHLPCGTDLMVIEELARRVVAAHPVILLPAVAYAYYPAFVDWPGSVSIAAVHFQNYVGDIIRSLSRHGAKKFLILDGGFSTHPPLRSLSCDLHSELGVRVAVTNLMGLGKEIEVAVCEQERGGHGDEAETSCMLKIRPDLVHMDRAVKELAPVIPGLFGKTGIPKVALGGKMRTPHGINGDPTLANPEKGRKILDAMVEDILIFLKEYEKM